MHIAIEALGIDIPGGCRSSILNLVSSLASLASGDQYTLILSRPENLSVQENGDIVRQVIVKPTTRMLDRLRLQFLLPQMVSSQKIDLVHHAKNLCSFGLPCPYVVTIHDLTMLRHPELFPPIDVAYWRLVEPVSVRNAAHVIAISHATSVDLQDYYRVAASRIAVVHWGYDAIYDQQPRDRSRTIARRYGVTGSYLLHVGSISRKKNLATLVRAYEVLHRRLGYQGMLLLVGQEYYKGKEDKLGVLIRELDLEDRVILTGAVGQDDMPGIYGGADACVFPSWHEGFGLVPLEAMACGVPVVAAASPAVREVVGPAGILIEPSSDHMALADAMRMALDPETNRLLSESGKSRSRLFSRQFCAEKTAAIYHRVGGFPV